jgi:hypothetical protein
MMSDGATFIDRIEKIEIITKDDTVLSTEVNIGKDDFGKLDLYLKSKLGQLLFIRQSRG